MPNTSQPGPVSKQKLKSAEPFKEDWDELDKCCPYREAEEWNQSWAENSAFAHFLTHTAARWSLLVAGAFIVTLVFMAFVVVANKEFKPWLAGILVVSGVSAIILAPKQMTLKVMLNEEIEPWVRWVTYGAGSLLIFLGFFVRGDGKLSFQAFGLWGIGVFLIGEMFLLQRHLRTPFLKSEHFGVVAAATYPFLFFQLSSESGDSNSPLTWITVGSLLIAGFGWAVVRSFEQMEAAREADRTASFNRRLSSGVQAKQHHLVVRHEWSLFGLVKGVHQFGNTTQRP